MPTQIPPEILKHWQSGHKIEAIKQLREQSGLGLKEAKDLLEASDEPDFVQHGATEQTQAIQQLREQLEKLGMKDATLLLDQLNRDDAASNSSFSSIKTTTTTVNGKTTTSVTVSGDHAEAIEALLSGANAVPAETRAEVEDAMARGNKIEAIKLLREATGLGLAQAKEHIDAAMDGIALDWQILQRQSVRASAQTDSRATATAPGEVPKGQGQYLWLLVLALAAAGLWYYFKMP
ncbi:ribosomal protein L7/L12 [Comamonas thiooxydans]|uniref:ribosomal protein L7/L12 n=1 Tax=Comamonas thiooxydans TaxID=363952 RepID=UPI002447755E|nr:ribosomal protein L7/L12 [Comamonas thiooxydans]MDH1253478.1 ribosomal protein L7/L12 [Comamonas thiooxydans]